MLAKGFASVIAGVVCLRLACQVLAVWVVDRTPVGAFVQEQLRQAMALGADRSVRVNCMQRLQVRMVAAIG